MKQLVRDRLIVLIFIVTIVITNSIQGYAIVTSIERSTKAEICAILMANTPEVGPAGVPKACGFE